MKIDYVSGLAGTVIFISLIWCGNGFKSTTSDVRPRPLWSQTGVDKLKKDLLTNYDKYVRPQEHDQVTVVRVGLAILNIETEESKSSIILNSWMRMLWNDSKLQWNASEYANISVIYISDHEIWQPDIYIYNSALGSGQLPRYGNPNMLVYPTGDVLYVPPVKLTALCDFDMSYWPFDVQHCYIKLGSWVYNGNEILLELYNNDKKADLESTVNISEWNIRSIAEIVTKKYDCCEEEYYSVVFNLTLTRKTMSYAAAFVAPAIVTTFFVLLQFWLPPDASEKIYLNGFVIVILNMFIIYLNHRVVGVGSKTPFIVLFYSRCLCIVTCNTGIAIVMYCLSKIQMTQSTPIMLQKLLRSKLGQFLYFELNLTMVFFWNKKNVQHTNNEILEIRRFSDCELKRKPSLSQQWHVLMVVVDRLLFLVCSIAFFIMAIVYA